MNRAFVFTTIWVILIESDGVGQWVPPWWYILSDGLASKAVPCYCKYRSRRTMLSSQFPFSGFAFSTALVFVSTYAENRKKEGSGRGQTKVSRTDEKGQWIGRCGDTGDESRVCQLRVIFAEYVRFRGGCKQLQLDELWFRRCVSVILQLSGFCWSYCFFQPLCIGNSPRWCD